MLFFIHTVESILPCTCCNLMQVKEDVVGGVFKDVATADGEATYVNIPKLEANRNYKFQVAAVNSVGAGSFAQTKPVTVTKAISEFIYKFNVHLVIWIQSIHIEKDNLTRLIY